MKRICSFILLILFQFSFILVSADQSIQDLKKIVVYIGKLKFKSEVPVKYLKKPQLKQYIEEVFEEEYPDELAEKESLFLKLMGFSSNLINIKKIRKKILIANIGGLYNEKTKELFVLNEYRNINLFNSLIIVHELRHSIQDQHFNLSRMLGNLSDFDDRKIAVLSAIEGDATFVMLKYSGINPELFTSSYNFDTLMSFSPLKNTEAIYSAPDIVKYQLIMPYFEGLRFVNSIFNRKRLKGVNNILKSPPVSSEQILHPRKYLRNEKPVKVSINYKPKGYKLNYSGVIGEYYLNILLKSGDKYIDYAFGWGGDKFQIYLNSKSYFFLWESSWDKEKYCSNFFFDFRRFVEKKFNIIFKGNKDIKIPFIAGKSTSGYFFMIKVKDKIFYVRSNDRNQINEFINGGNYD